MTRTIPSRRRGRLTLAVAAAAATCLGLTPAAVADSSSTQRTDSTAPTSASAPGDVDAATHGRITALMKRMTLEEKVGQLFVTHAYGSDAHEVTDAEAEQNQELYGVDTPAEVVRKYHLGGVIYFTWTNSVQDPEQIAQLSNGLQRTAEDERLSVPLLLSTDQEQGLVARVGPPATQFPGNMALGAGRSTDDARAAASITGEELRALGITQDYAPVADVNVNPLNPVIGVRSFSSDPGLAADMTAAQVAGYQGAGVAATAKHFPGHGDTDVDSHYGFPVITHTREEWERLDAPPFRAAIDEGVDSIMTAHLQVPALDPSGDPATLSKPIISGVLRDELGYDGLVVTDALGMAGVREKYGDARVPVLALKAGVDQLLMPPRMDLAYESVLEAVRSGEITEERIDESVYRVLRLKAERGLFRDRYVDPSAVDETVGTDAHLATAQQVTDRTVTLVKDDTDALPLSTDAGDVLVTGWGQSTTQTLAENVAARGPATSVHTTGSSPTAADIEAAAAEAEDHDLTVVTTNRAWASQSQQDLVEALTDTGTPVVVVAVRDPYDVAYTTEAPTFLATYSYTDVALESVTRVMFGETEAAGRLPVSVPTADDPDTTLYPFGHGLEL